MSVILFLCFMWGFTVPAAFFAIIPILTRGEIDEDFVWPYFLCVGFTASSVITSIVYWTGNLPV